MRDSALDEVLAEINDLQAEVIYKTEEVKQLQASIRIMAETVCRLTDPNWNELDRASKDVLIDVVVNTYKDLVV